MMDLIAAERRELADVLGSLSATQWQAPSLCAGWTAAHVVAHLTMPFRISPQEFAAGLEKAGGHGLDITWPQAIEYPIPGQALATVLDLIAGDGSKSLFGIPLDGIELHASDLDWSSGAGAQLTGRSRDLLLLIAGRAIPHEAFSGPGGQLLGDTAR